MARDIPPLRRFRGPGATTGAHAFVGGGRQPGLASRPHPTRRRPSARRWPTRSACRASARSCTPEHASSSPSTTRRRRPSARSARSRSKRVLDELREAGVPEENVTLICANALHRKWTREELARVLGAVARRPLRRRASSATTPRTRTTSSTSARPQSGYDVELHRLVVEARPHRLRQRRQPPRLQRRLEVRRRRPLDLAVHPPHAHAGRHVDVRARQPHAPRLRRAGPLHRDRSSASASSSSRPSSPTRRSHRPRLGRRRRRVPRRRHGVPGAAATRRAAPRASRPTSSSTACPTGARTRRSRTMNPILTLISSALGYLGGYIEAVGKPGCSVIIATPCPEQWDMEHHPSYKEVWERVLPAVEGPVRDHRALRRGVRHARRLHRAATASAYAFHPRPRHPRHAPAQAPAPRRPRLRRRRRGPGRPRARRLHPHARPSKRRSPRPSKIHGPDCYDRLRADASGGVAATPSLPQRFPPPLRPLVQRRQRCQQPAARPRQPVPALTRLHDPRLS